MGSSDLTRGLRADHSTLLFGLAPGGVYLASTITDGPVSSYLAFSPLPREIEFFALQRQYHAISLHVPVPVFPRIIYYTGRYVFCGTFPRWLGAAVSSHPVLWSPDFPPPDHQLGQSGGRSLDPL